MIETDEAGRLTDASLQQLEAELDATKRVIRILAKLTHKERRRTMAYLVDKYITNPDDPPKEGEQQ